MTRETGRDERVEREQTGGRAQMVLLAAAVAALALLPIAAAYFQLGAHPDVRARTDPGVTADRVVAGVDRAATNASLAVSGRWADRDRTVERFRDAFAGDVRGIRRAAANRTVLVRVTRNDSAARTWADANCPGGPNRAFGSCDVRDGLVLQSRDGRVHVVALAVDIAVADPDGETRVTLVVRPVG